MRITSLDDPYFKGTFLGARRVKTDGSENLIAEAESRLNDYAEEKAVRDIYRSHKSSHNVAANDDHGKNRGKDKDKNSKDKDRSKSRDKYVEVASLDKKNGSNRKIEVDKADKSGKSSGKSSEKSSSKEDKSDKKSSASSSKSGSSKQEAAKSEHKSESRKS